MSVTDHESDGHYGCSYGGDVDEQGVDRSQIRRMLSMSVIERLQWLEETMAEIDVLRRLNVQRKIR
jgi:hypothetical protein